MADERIDLTVPGGDTTAYLSTPEGWPPGPAVVVIQEWWGLNDHIESIARRMRDAGFAGLAPDLFHGKQTTEPDDAQKLMMELDRDRALADLEASVTWLTEHGATSVGVIGFCMGGGLAWELALNDDRIGAVGPFYGGVEFGERRVRVPFQAHYAGHDHYPPEMLDAVRAHLDDVPGSELFMYPDASHAFMNDTRPEVYRADDAAMAWERLTGFLRATLT
jgi:carboxymethylenebutenolidase